jgi:hypothetical protein
MDEAEDLWSLPRPRREVSEIAVFGSHEDDLTIASGFLRVAEIAARHWIAHGPDDSLPVPILFNYRHGIELTLKWLIRLAARCLVRDGYTRENLSRAKLDEKLRTHNIRKLADWLDRYMGLLRINAPENHIDSASRQLLDWLDSEDETGEAFRYATIGYGNERRAARPDQVQVNFYEQVNELHKLANLLFSGYSSFLDAHEEMQIDYYDHLDSLGP